MGADDGFVLLKVPKKDFLELEEDIWFHYQGFFKVKNKDIEQVAAGSVVSTGCKKLSHVVIPEVSFTKDDEIIKPKRKKK